MANPLVSVVIATFRRPHLVSHAIKSVLLQDYRDVEVLVVDDGPTDETELVVKAIADPRVRYIRHSHNRGLPATRNTGIRAAAGELIAFLDDDDLWCGDKLRKQVAAISDREAVLVGALVNGRYPRLHGQAEVTLDDLRKGNIFPPSGLMVRAFVIREVWFDETLRQGEDWDIYIRLASRQGIGYVNEPLVLLSDGVHQRMTNAVRNLPVSELEKRMVMLRKHRHFFGPYWFRRHSAAVVLSYFRARAGKRAQLRHAVREYGLFPVAGALMGKLARAWRCRRADVLAYVFRGPGTNRF